MSREKLIDKKMDQKTNDEKILQELELLKLWCNDVKLRYSFVRRSFFTGKLDKSDLDAIKTIAENIKRKAEKIEDLL